MDTLVPREQEPEDSKEDRLQRAIANLSRIQQEYLQRIGRREPPSDALSHMGLSLASLTAWKTDAGFRVCEALQHSAAYGLIPSLAADVFESSAVGSVLGVVDISNDPDASTRDKLRAHSMILDRTNPTPKGPGVNIQINGPHIFLADYGRDRRGEPLRPVESAGDATE